MGRSASTYGGGILKPKKPDRKILRTFRGVWPQVKGRRVRITVGEQSIMGHWSRRRQRRNRERELAAGLLAACLILAAVAPGVAAELAASAARASVRADDAKRHVAALADDALEGRAAGSRGGRAAGAYLVEEFERIGIDPAGNDGGYYQRFGTMRNVLGMLRGSDPKASREVVVVGAHYDHVGYGTSANSYGPTGHIHNGADDNASGVAGLLEVAEACTLLPQRPRRTIVFALLGWRGSEPARLAALCSRASAAPGPAHGRVFHQPRHDRQAAGAAA